jgi:hypothetical protein
MQITLKPLPPPHMWDIRGSERVHLALKIKAMMERENVYSDRSSSSIYRSCNSSHHSSSIHSCSNNDHKKNSMTWCSSPRTSTAILQNHFSYHHDNSYVAAPENFSDTMTSFRGNFIKIINNNHLIIATNPALHHHNMMCEWSYRIVDHIGGNRELVAISQNYLNRFLGKYYCW